MEREHYDIAVIGGGPGGYTAAVEAGKAGYHTILIEKAKVGGTCLHTGCIPTKTLLHAAGLYEQLKGSPFAGIQAEKVSCDWTELMIETKRIQQELEAGIQTLLMRANTDVIYGTAALDGSFEDGYYGISIDTMGKIYSKKVILAAGSCPVLPKIDGINHSAVLTSDSIFSLNQLPHSLCIIGGGVIGMELASVFAAFGCKVTVIEAMKQILNGFEKEIVQNLASILKKRGIEIHTDAKVIEIIEEYGTGQLICNFIKKNQNQFVLCDHVLCAAGRRPVTEKLFPEGMLGVEYGTIVLNSRFETSKGGIYAIGDLTGRSNLAHTASAQAKCVIAQIAGEAAPKDLSVVPSCIYTSPEIACAGITEKEGIASGRLIKTGKYITRSNSKSMITKQERGIIKIVADLRTDEILGAQLMCAHATDMIGELVTAISNQMTVTQLLRTIRAHPTYNEAVEEALADVKARSPQILKI